MSLGAEPTELDLVLVPAGHRLDTAGYVKLWSCLDRPPSRMLFLVPCSGVTEKYTEDAGLININRVRYWYPPYSRAVKVLDLIISSTQ
jgi:hypothetical protein